MNIPESRFPNSNQLMFQQMTNTKICSRNIPASGFPNQNLLIFLKWQNDQIGCGRLPPHPKPETTPPPSIIWKKTTKLCTPFWGPARDGIIYGKIIKKPIRFCFCSTWQLVKNWRDGNDRDHILRHYSHRIWNIPSDEIAKSWKIHDFRHSY